jgi:arylsulfatase A-like enzyme
VIALDIHPTALAAAGGEMPKDKVYDGVSLLPHLDGTRPDAPHEALYWRFTSSAIRRGSWKLLVHPGEAPKLFDLAADVGEKKDLAAEKPELVKDLSGALAKWDAELAKPLWGHPRRRPR